MLTAFRPRSAILRGLRLVFASIVAAAVLTWILVFSGLDWAYFALVQNFRLFGPLAAADSLGYAFPVLVVPGLFLAAGLRPRNRYGIAGIAVLIAAALALAVSMALKAVTGRASPPHHLFGADLARADNSRAFDFGFMNESILGGWPSSHATVAFAIAVTLLVALPAARGLHVICLILAAFIGIGVTLGYHWLSEFFSGALIGAGIGLWVGGLGAGPVSRAEQRNSGSA